MCRASRRCNVPTGSRWFLFFLSHFQMLIQWSRMSSSCVTVFNLDLYNIFLVTRTDYNMFEIAGTISFIAPWRAVMHEQFWQGQVGSIKFGARCSLWGNDFFWFTLNRLASEHLVIQNCFRSCVYTDNKSWIFHHLQSQNQDVVSSWGHHVNKDCEG